METLQQSSRFASWCRAIVLAACALGASVAWAQNRIVAVRVVGETAREVTLEVDYTYAGDHGASVFMAAYANSDTDPTVHTGFGPGPVQAGRGRTRVSVGAASSAPAWFTTQGLRVEMYVGGGNPFASAEFAFPKAWSTPAASLPPLLRLIGGAPSVRVVPGVAVPPGAATDVVQRRFAADGAVELVYRDGTVKRLFRGGYTLVKPDGTASQVRYSSAQAPTPPGPPADEPHRAWAEHENARLLQVIRTLVGANEATVQNYLAREPAELSAYGRISTRTEAIQWMLGP